MNTSPSKRPHRNIASCLILTGGLFGLGPLLFPTTSTAAEVSFNRDVRPILSDKCFRCHGPDAAALEGDLRLDLREDVVKERDGYRVITPGHPGESVLIDRIFHEDDDEVMPPADSRSKLSAAEKEILRRWISEDARYEKHWSLVKPTRTEISEKGEATRTQNVLDAFVLARLKKEGMSFSQEASRETLIRRLSIDLTGLPPSIEEIDAFLADKSPDAYSRLVDRLLNSPRYGEKMAVHWLDSARYADTNGYFSDGNRTMWPWRDWVIHAFNENMPFDQFTIEQLAGDILPKPTQSQLIASGFNRNHMTNNETGIDEEEFRTEYVADRVKTTSMVWMGLTMECARCHDHKYDPISQKDYYRFFAFFNNVPERGLATGSGGSAPLLAVPSARQIAEGEALKTTLEEREKEFRPMAEALNLAQAKWETSVLDTLPEINSKGLISHLDFDENDRNAPAGELKGRGIETVETVAGQMGNAIALNGNSVVEIPASPRFERADSFSLAAWINTRESSPGCVISKMDETTGFRGFDLVVRRSMVIASLKSNQQDGGSLIVAAEDKLPTRQWYHILLTYNGSGKAAGLQIYLDGKPAQMQVISDSLKGNIATDEPFRVGGRKTSAFFQGSIDEVLIYDRKLENGEVLHLANNQFLRGVISTPVKERSQFEADGLREHFLLTAATETQKKAVQKMKAIRDMVAEHKAAIPVVMVMKEKDGESTAHILERGEYNQPGEKVGAGVPEIFESASQNPPLKSQDRLDLAQWLVSPENPLTSRVIVNRIWQQLFGTGIVDHPIG